MDIRTYEFHNLEGQKLPIIFHYNVIRKGEPEIANWHENVEILYFTKGFGQVICNSVVYDVEAGDMIIVNSDLLHGVKKTKQGEYYCLIVDSAFLAENDIPVKEIAFESFVRSDTAAALFESTAREIQSQEDYHVAGVRANLLNLMVYLARHHSTGTIAKEKTRGSIDENIKQAIAYINANFSGKLSLEMLADEVSLSKFYFAREFKKATGMTVVAYINATRCRNARNLLLGQKHSISEIAAMCGFENNSYFSKTFKNIMGCLPSELVRMS
ncbi:MAG: helix-turn-helix transcriptional regulator [Lachnospiraceae bacterium]|nr:helix-turn-helix transcriptional regulator [Lachnospiraceae bacterium]